MRSRVYNKLRTLNQDFAFYVNHTVAKHGRCDSTYLWNKEWLTDYHTDWHTAWLTDWLTVRRWNCYRIWRSITLVNFLSSNLWVVGLSLDSGLWGTDQSEVGECKTWRWIEQHLTNHHQNLCFSHQRKVFWKSITLVIILSSNLWVIRLSLDCGL